MNKYFLFLSGFIVLALLSFSFKDQSEIRYQEAEEVTYESHIGPLMYNYCTTCHGGNAPAAGIRLTSYDEVRKQTEKGKLLIRINDHANPMPQNGLLPKELRDQVQLWADAGYPMGEANDSDMAQYSFTPPSITPVNVDEKGFDLLEKMQGHWVGKIDILGQHFSWFAFDYRAIAPSHVHGIYEGGTMGNLFTSFFVADLNGTKTIMARNGGILNGIYRTSYFVLDKVEYKGKESYYRLVDAYGGDQIMWMELRFKGESLTFNSYTSRFGTYPKPTKHMSFKGKKMHLELSEKAAAQVNFPQNVIDRDFSKGLPVADWGAETPTTSASFIWEDTDQDLVSLGKLCGDPYRIDEMPFVSKLSVDIERHDRIKDSKLLIFLSKDDLTDKKGALKKEYGYLSESVMNGILSFPEIEKEEDSFTFTYLHPGTYYVTVIADRDGDSYPGPGDLSCKSVKIEVTPKGEAHVKISGVTAVNK